MTIMAQKRLTIEKFQNYGAIFENISKNEMLKNELAEYGYDEQEIAKGKALYDNAAQKLDLNKTETAEEKMAYDTFSKKFEELKKSYTTDRKKAKIIFKDEDTILTVLAIKGVMSIRIGAMLDDVDTFYKQLQAKEELRTPLKRLKITDEHIAGQLKALTEVRQAYLQYTNEKGESQQATKNKDAAFEALEKWVREFYSIAKIALEDQPQLLESLGKFMRN
ncbi:hypothetical protein RCZ01_20120 [Capnocytophaga felis]|uniref:Uncharacterized protein n=2 Tax=Capnocytophaga felis TaxID=2267611 RepID=A0A5M4BB99_9FLAO|nr:hypothetical protein RCZ01_20120 [Capnocytophaga felis]GET49532.1 hypothetical protein RCZ02_23630 [Capnocytophaga felis]